MEYSKKPLFLLGFILLLATPVFAASVSLIPRTAAPYGVDLKTKYGDLTVTNSQTMKSFTVYANGSIVLDLRGFERSQVTYTYLVTSYGNGTFNLQFLTAGQTPRVVAKLATTASYVSFNEIVNYSTNTVNDPLVLTFLGSASQQLFNAAVVGSFFAGLMFISIGALFSVSMYSKVRQGLTGEKPIITSNQALAVGFFAIVGWIIVIVIAVAFGGVLAGLGI